METPAWSPKRASGDGRSTLEIQIGTVRIVIPDLKSLVGQSR